MPLPFKLRLGRRSQQYNVASKELFVIPVELLDQSAVECTLLAHSVGQECLQSVCQRLGLQDVRIFGLLCYSKRAMFQWIDLDKPVKKQLEKFSDTLRLYLRVQLFVPNIDQLTDPVSRSHYYLQLKVKLRYSYLRACSPMDLYRCDI